MSQREKESLQHQAEHTRPRRSSIMVYLVILFAAAFLLLLLAYFQQQRANSETSDALQKSVSAVGTIENMMSENETLRQEVETLKSDYQALDDLYQKEVQAHLQLEGERVALDYLWRIQRLWDRGKRNEALVLVEQFESSGATSSLPRTNPSGVEGNSPMDQYNALLDALGYREEP